jgi:hypothetical protein
VKIGFRPVFASIDDGTHWSGFGIKVSKSTGEVSFPGAPHADAPQNFIIEAFVTKNDGGTTPADQIPVVPIRVHVHTGVRRIWVTPSTLTVRRRAAAGAESTNYRLTVRAEFTDDTVGDVTLQHGIMWTPAANVELPTAQRPGFLTIPAGVAASAAPIVLTASAPASWGVQPAEGRVIIAPPWSDDPTRPKVDLKDGALEAAAPTTFLPARVPNVLLLGQGFVQADLDARLFDKIANGFTYWLRTSTVTRPFDRLSASINYWMTALPAGGRGVSVRCEVYTSSVKNPETDVTEQVALPVALGTAPVAGEDWTVSTLVYMAGLPLAADARANRTAAQLREQWSTTLRTPPPSSLTNAIIGEWQDFATRTFFDEIDSFPGTTLGSAPSASAPETVDGVKIDPERGGQEALDALLVVLTAANGTTLPGNAALGDMWAHARTDLRFDNRGYLVIVSNTLYGRAFADERYVSLPLLRGPNRLLFNPIPGRNALTLDTSALTPTGLEDQAVYRILAHELSHQFGLGDEYAENVGIFAGGEKDLAFFSNLTSEAEVARAGRTNIGGFHPFAIKWNWDRILKAAVMSAPPVDLGGRVYDVKLLAPGGVLFAPNDRVRLRSRRWRVPLGAATVLGDYEVVSVNAAGDLMRIREAAPITVGPSISEFTEGALVYSPMPAPDSVRAPDYLYACIISRGAQRFIESDGPMTGKTCVPDKELKRGTALQVALDLPIEDWVVSWSRRNVPRVVGLYSGGNLAACGIFHPTGWCMMRNDSQYPRGEQQFCPVCRYALIDFIDPTLHFWNDRDYAEISPES